MKICVRCKDSKPETEYGRKGDGFKSECKVCIKELNAISYAANIVERQNAARVYGRDHSEDRKIKSAKWREENPEKVRVNTARWNTENARYLVEFAVANRAANPDVRMIHNTRTRILQVLKGKYKSAHTVELLGCSIEDLKIHIEAKFTQGMTWDNQGKSWHLDHIQPCASFDLSDPEQQRTCFHYTNLQPLGKKENMYWGDEVYKKGKWKPGYPDHLKSKHNK